MTDSHSDHNHDDHTHKDLLRPGDADGIKEFDNQLPRWWVGLFVVTVIFGGFYWFNMQFMGGKTLIQEYSEKAKEGAPVSTAGAPQPATATEPAQIENLAEKIALPENIAKGKEVFTTYCVPCHGPDGGGVIGPNLTDKYWIHGGKPEQIVNTITKGVPEKGMLTWGPVLGPEKVLQVAAFVHSLQGTTPANPKAPDGNLEQ